MTTPTREQVMPEPFGYVSDGFPDGLHFKHKPWGEMHMLVHSVSAVYSASQLLQAIEDAKAAGRDQGLREAKEAFSLSEHMHKRNTGLMVCVSDLSAVIVRMAAGIDHLSETARQWEPDHSSGADRRGWVLATEARDDALRLLKEHAVAIEQLRGK